MVLLKIEMPDCLFNLEFKFKLSTSKTCLLMIRGTAAKRLILLDNQNSV